MLIHLTRLIHQSWFIVSLCVGIITGVIIGLVFRINYFTSPLWLGFAIILLTVAFVKPRLAFISISIIAGLILAFFRIAAELIGENYIKNLYDQTIIVTGVVDGDPDQNESSMNLKLNNLKFSENQIPLQGSIFITVRSNQDIIRGDTITVNGKLSSGFGTYAGYMYKPIIKNIYRPEPGSLILKIRNWFAARITSLVPDPESSLGLSYLLGMKSNLPNDLSKNLRIVGLVHIVVASGAHLSILVEIARKLFGKISRFAGLLFSVLFILFFMTMVGFTPSIMRAGIMSILNLLAWYVGRKFAPWRIILIVAAITLIINPMFIINLGWLLSFASFAGIMILGPKLTSFFYREKPGFIASTVITTISATIMTLPITLYYYGMVSLISLAANLLILPTLSYAMGLTFLTGVFANIPFLNQSIAFLTAKLLDFHIFVVNFFSDAKSFLITIDPYNPRVFLIYVVIAIPLVIGLIRQKMVKSKQLENNHKREILCLDIANGPPPNVKKP